MSINAASQLRSTFKRLAESKAPDVLKQNDLFADEIAKTTQLHLKYVLFMMAKQRITDYKFTDSRLPPILLLLLRVFALKELIEESRLLYEEGFFNKGSSNLLSDAYNMCLRELRPHMLPLVEISDVVQEDAWNISTIGNRFGDIYETQLEVAKNSRLNTGKPPPYYEKLMKPIMNGSHAKL